MLYLTVQALQLTALPALRCDEANRRGVRPGGCCHVGSGTVVNDPWGVARRHTLYAFDASSGNRQSAVTFATIWDWVGDENCKWKNSSAHRSQCRHRRLFLGQSVVGLTRVMPLGVAQARGTDRSGAATRVTTASGPARTRLLGLPVTTQALMQSTILSRSSGMEKKIGATDQQKRLTMMGRSRRCLHG